MVGDFEREGLETDALATEALATEAFATEALATDAFCADGLATDRLATEAFLDILTLLTGDAFAGDFYLTAWAGFCAGEACFLGEADRLTGDDFLGEGDRLGEGVCEIDFLGDGDLTGLRLGDYF